MGAEIFTWYRGKLVLKDLGQFSQGQWPGSSGARCVHCLTADNFIVPLVLRNMLSEIAL